MLFLCSSVTNWLEKWQLPCFYKSLLGVDCPGCGMQRAFIALLKGDMVESLKLYPALIPTIIMVMVLGLHLCFKLKEGARILLYLFIGNTIIIVASYIYKLIINYYG